MIDLIGDIHGYADELKKLLKKLGYSKTDNYYSHPNRKVLFVGDYIDRGPKNRETLEIVKQMADNGSAIALMGNHEYNALCFHYKDSNGKYLRTHSEKNIGQHRKTLDEFKNRQGELEMYLDWFKTLPLFYETEGFRAVHACWDSKNIAYLEKHLDNNRLNDELLLESVKEETALYNAIENTLKGKEIALPDGINFLDNDDYPRSQLRIKWWEDPSEMTYKEISVKQYTGLSNDAVELGSEDQNYYKRDEKSVFFGHYALDNEPYLLKDNVCCLDFGVITDNGILASYSFEGELVLDEKKFNQVETFNKVEPILKE